MFGCNGHSLSEFLHVNASHKGDVFYFHRNFLMLGYSNITQLSPFEQFSRKAFEDYIVGHKVIVISLHHWEFFYDKELNVVGNSLNKKALESAIEKIQWLQNTGAQFLTISQFYKKLRDSDDF